MDRVTILQGILNRGASGVRLEELVQGPAIGYEYSESTPLEEKISTFLEILEQEEKNERWASGITTYQISQIKQFSAFDGELYVESASNEVVVIKRSKAICTVCLNEIKAGEMVRELVCKHRFHKKCIDYWLRLKAVCPVDRKSMLGL